MPLSGRNSKIVRAVAGSALLLVIDPVGILFFIMASQKIQWIIKVSTINRKIDGIRVGEEKVVSLLSIALNLFNGWLYIIKVNLKHLTERNDGVEDH